MQFRVNLVNWLNRSIDYLEKLRRRLVTEETKKSVYKPLSPTSNADGDGVYFDALAWALENKVEEDIKNIAISGPYGSGKTSVLKTFQNNYKGDDLKFLNISLATFKEDEESNKKRKPKSDSQSLPRLIEVSILQQIFYHEEDKNIPDSSFKKIKSINKWNLRFLTFCSFLFLMSILPLVNYNQGDVKWVNLFFTDNLLFYCFTILYFLVANYLLFSFLYKKNNSKAYFFKIPKFLIGFNFLVIALLLYHFTKISYTSVVWQDSLKNILVVVSFCYASCFVFYIIYSSVRLVANISLKKFKFQNAEIEIDKKINKSILNHHLDEIIYFFEATKYNVVIIEDLDRFTTSEVFTKLRELNLLLNNSKKTRDKNIVFIYAVRDNMFTDTERTKFFDFIIPIIPIINSSNSSEKLKSRLKKFKLSEEFVENVSFFIDDMRLLHNTCNEFHIYRSKLETGLLSEKLFSMILYKNIDPTDFVKLSQRKGNLYKCFKHKDNHIKLLLKEVDEKIEEISEEIKRLGDVTVKNIKDLRLIYISRVFEYIDSFSAFKINSSEVSILELTEESNFEYFKLNKLKYKRKVWNSSYGRFDTNEEKIPLNFQEIEDVVDSTKKYLEVEKDVADVSEGKVMALKKDIRELENSKSLLRNFTISQLLNESLTLQNSIKKNRNLIITLLRNGYLAEDYIDYVSLFHEGAITRSDYNFLISIKSSIQTNYDYKLERIENLLKKINSLDFSTCYVFNYNLLDFIITNIHNYTDLEYLIFNKLKDESKESIAFIIGFLENGKNRDEFIRILCSYWFNIWNWIDNDSMYSEKQIYELYLKIIQNSEVNSINAIAENSNLIRVISQDSNFLSLLENSTKTKKVIKLLNPHFEDLDFENSSSELLTFIYEGDFYDFKIPIFIKIIKQFGSFDQSIFDTSNYLAITNSGCEKLIQFVNRQPDKYIQNIYLKIDSNIQEDNKSLKALLNLSLNETNVSAIVKSVVTKADNLSDVDKPTVRKILIVENKVEPSWENLFISYIDDDNVIDDAVVGFINLPENAKSLSESKIPNDIEAIKTNDFCREILTCNNIDDEAFQLISKSSRVWFSDLELDALSLNKVKSLIKNHCLKPSLESFNLVKAYDSEIAYLLFEEHTNEYSELLSDIELDKDDLEGVLLSEHLPLSFKQVIVQNISEEELLSKAKNLELIGEILMLNKTFDISTDLKKSILLNSDIADIKRIEFYNSFGSLRLNNIETEEFLNSMDDQFKEITNKKIKALLPNTPLFKEFLRKLAFFYISSHTETKKGLRVNHKLK